MIRFQQLTPIIIAALTISCKPSSTFTEQKACSHSVSSSSAVEQATNYGLDNLNLIAQAFYVSGLTVLRSMTVKLSTANVTAIDFSIYRGLSANNPDSGTKLWETAWNQSLGSATITDITLTISPPIQNSPSDYQNTYYLIINGVGGQILVQRGKPPGSSGVLGRFMRIWDGTQWLPEDSSIVMPLTIAGDLPC